MVSLEVVLDITNLREYDGLQDIEIDPLDAFMASEVMPEVQAKEEEEKKKASDERAERLKLLAVGI